MNLSWDRMRNLGGLFTGGSAAREKLPVRLGRGKRHTTP